MKHTENPTLCRTLKQSTTPNGTFRLMVGEYGNFETRPYLPKRFQVESVHIGQYRQFFTHAEEAEKAFNACVLNPPPKPEYREWSGGDGRGPLGPGIGYRSGGHWE